jgi:hypothetical protein
LFPHEGQAISIPPISSGNRNCWPHLGHFFKILSVMVGFDQSYIIYRVRPETVKLGRKGEQDAAKPSVPRQAGGSQAVL